MNQNADTSTPPSGEFDLEASVEKLKRLAADMQRPVGGRLGTFEVSKSAMAAAIRQGLREFPGVRIFETQSTSFTGR